MRDTFRKLMTMMDPHERRRFWQLMALVAVMGLANMAGIASVMPFLAVLSDPGLIDRTPVLSDLYAWSGAEDRLDFLLMLGVGVVVTYVAGLAFRAGTTAALFYFSAMRSHSFAMRTLGSYLGRDYPWFLGRHSADLAKNVLAEVDQVINSVLLPTLNLFSNVAMAACLFVLLVVVNPWIALFVGTLLGGGYLLVFLVVRQRLSRLGRRRVRANRARFQVAQEGLAGIKEIKVLGLERNLLRRFSEPALQVAKVSATNALLNQVPRNLLEALAFGGMMAVVLTLAYLESGNLSEILPVAGLYAVAGSRLAPALQEIYRTIASIRFAKPALDSLFVDIENAPALPPRSDRIIHLRESLAFDQVTFAYPGATRGALQGLSLTIPAHASIGLVGGTGAGKTTAIDLVMGLLEPASGRILVDGQEIATEEDRRAWRRSIGYVPQQIFLIDDTVAANIAFGVAREKIDMEAVERAARMAELHAFVVEELPDGYDTRVGDRGVRLSGGQRQRIGIARALYHDPDVLVLDEATSALDNITERAVMEAVSRLGGVKTVIMIAHRLTTVMNCDRIFLLRNGRVEGEGSYEELLSDSSTFREMVQGHAA